MAQLGHSSVCSFHLGSVKNRPFPILSIIKLVMKKKIIRIKYILIFTIIVLSIYLSLLYFTWNYYKITGIFLNDCNELDEIDTEKLNNFFKLDNLNWDITYWCNTIEIRSKRAIINEKLPIEISKLTNLQKLHIENKNLLWEIPIELGNLKKLKYLSLAWNNLTGEIPKELWNLKKLEFLNISGNKIDNYVPESIINLPNLKYIKK